jgi:hypothetical protein
LGRNGRERGRIKIGYVAQPYPKTNDDLTVFDPAIT